jgi:hypothetical protein
MSQERRKNVKSVRTARTEKEANAMANVQIRKRQWVALLLAAAMLLELLPFAALNTYAAEADGSNVTFVDEDGNTTSIAAWMRENKYEDYAAGKYQIITDFPAEIGKFTLGDTEKITWYVAEQAADWTESQNTRISVQGDVRLILQENSAVVNVHALDILANSSLTIYGATTGTGENMGELNIDTSQPEIGIDIEQGGKLAIYGGRVSVPAGMGLGQSGIKNEDGGTLSIGGGKLTITGDNIGSGAGIDGAVTITGGTVDVNVSNSATAFTGPTTITGGTVNATGGIGLAGATTVNGNAMVTASSIAQEDRTDWNGLVCEPDEDGNLTTMQVYGEVTLTENTEIPEGMTLSIPAESTLTLAEGVTLTLDKVSNQGVIVKDENSTVETHSGTNMADGEDGLDLGTVVSTAGQNATNATQPTQSVTNVQSAPVAQGGGQASDDGSGMLLLLVGGGIAVGAVVYYRVKEQRKAAAEAQLDTAATDETAEAVAEEPAADAVAAAAEATQAAETMPEMAETAETLLAAAADAAQDMAA